MLSLRNFTEPSAKAKFAPPGCRLRKPHWPRFRHGGLLGGSDQFSECGAATFTWQAGPPLSTGGALSRGTTNAPPVMRTSPGQAGAVAVQGGPPQAPATFQKLKCELLASSSLNRDVSPNIIVLLVPSRTSATRYEMLAPKSPSLSLTPQRLAALGLAWVQAMFSRMPRTGAYEVCAVAMNWIGSDTPVPSEGQTYDDTLL